MKRQEWVSWRLSGLIVAAVLWAVVTVSPCAAQAGGGFFGGALNNPLNHQWRGIVSVKHTRSVDGIPVHTRSMFGMVISQPTPTEQRQVVVTAAELTEQPVESEGDLLDGNTQEEIEVVPLQSEGGDSGGYGGGYGRGGASPYGGASSPYGGGAGYGGAAGGGDGGAGQTQPVFRGVSVRGQADGLLFLLVPTDASQPLPMVQSAAKSDADAYFQLDANLQPEELDASEPQNIAKEGSVMVNAQGWIGLCTETKSNEIKYVDYKLVIRAYAKVRKTPMPVDAGGIVGPGGFAQGVYPGPGLPNVGGGGMGGAGMGFPAVPDSGESALTQVVIDALTRLQLAKTEDEKQASTQALQAALTEQFVAQRKTKQLELSELRQRLETLTAEETTKAAQQEAIIQSRLRQLIGSEAGATDGSGRPSGPASTGGPAGTGGAGSEGASSGGGGSIGAADGGVGPAGVGGDGTGLESRRSR